MKYVMIVMMRAGGKNLNLRKESNLNLWLQKRFEFELGARALVDIGDRGQEEAGSNNKKTMAK